MTLTETIQRTEALITERLQEKTSWGRNEILALVQECTKQVRDEVIAALETKAQ